MSCVRAIRYRILALTEQDKANADLLLKLADECDRGRELISISWIRPLRGGTALVCDKCVELDKLAANCGS
jgi:hypothetical protein